MCMWSFSFLGPSNLFQNTTCALIPRYIIISSVLPQARKSSINVHNRVQAHCTLHRNHSRNNSNNSNNSNLHHSNSHHDRLSHGLPDALHLPRLSSSTSQVSHRLLPSRHHPSLDMVMPFPRLLPATETCISSAALFAKRQRTTFISLILAIMSLPWFKPKETSPLLELGMPVPLSVMS